MSGQAGAPGYVGPAVTNKTQVGLAGWLGGVGRLGCGPGVSLGMVGRRARTFAPLLLAHIPTAQHQPSPPLPSPACLPPCLSRRPQLDFDPAAQGEFRVYVINLDLQDGWVGGGTAFLRAAAAAAPGCLPLAAACAGLVGWERGSVAACSSAVAPPALPHPLPHQPHTLRCLPQLRLLHAHLRHQWGWSGGVQVGAARPRLVGRHGSVPVQAHPSLFGAGLARSSAAPQAGPAGKETAAWVALDPPLIRLALPPPPSNHCRDAPPVTISSSAGTCSSSAVSLSKVGGCGWASAQLAAAACLHRPASPRGGMVCVCVCGAGP